MQAVARDDLLHRTLAGKPLTASAGTEVAAFDAMKSGLCDGRILLEVWVLDRPWRRFYEGFKQSLVCRVLVARLPIRFKGGRA